MSIATLAEEGIAGFTTAQDGVYLFYVTATESGELAFEWVDDAGERGDARAAIVVT